MYAIKKFSSHCFYLIFSSTIFLRLQQNKSKRGIEHGEDIFVKSLTCKNIFDSLFPLSPFFLPFPLHLCTRESKERATQKWSFCEKCNLTQTTKKRQKRNISNHLLNVFFQKNFLSTYVKLKTEYIQSTKREIFMKNAIYKSVRTDIAKERNRNHPFFPNIFF